MSHLRHVITGEEFNDLASGQGNSHTIAMLRQTQYSKWLKTLGSILDSCKTSLSPEIISLLSIAQETNAEMFTDTATLPQSLMWATKCLESAVGFGLERPLPAHLAHLDAMTAVMLFRSGRSDIAITTRIYDGGVMLPGIGFAVFPGCEDGETAEIQVAADAAARIEISTSKHSVSTSDTDSVYWLPLRPICAVAGDLELRVQIDDVDPYRCYYGENAVPTSRLPEADIQRWIQEIQKAWQLLVDHHYEYAQAIGEGVRTIVPLADLIYQRNQTSPDAFGGIAMTRSIDHEWIAFHLLDGFQRSKISALHDLLPLHNATSEKRYFATWFDAPRSFHDLLEGAYAQPLITEFWSKQSASQTSSLAQAGADIQRIRTQLRLRGICQQLGGIGMMTDWGEHILNGIVMQLEDLEGELPTHFDDPRSQIALQTERDYRICWRLQNLVPDQEAIRILAHAWSNKQPCPEVTCTLIAQPHSTVSGHQTRRLLAMARSWSPEHFVLLKNDPELVRAEFPNALRADVIFTDGNYELAAKEYAQGILAAPPQHGPPLEHWAGLAITHIQRGSIAALTLEQIPEVVAWLHTEASHSDADDSQLSKLAEWMQPLTKTIAYQHFTPVEFA